MTSNLDVERVAKFLGRTASSPPPSRLQYQPFLFDCSCGATIEMTGKKETCWNCGETVEVRRCVETPHGEKYTLRIGKHRQHWNSEPLLWPPGLPPAATTHQTWHYHESPDFNERCLRLGLLIMLSPLWVPLLLALLLLLKSVLAPTPVGHDPSNDRSGQAQQLQR
jgi:predicted RNA-binding Zn-ribbon protein involved in translation (DUF1610 family)